jgi:D-lactate dehydrogenase
MKMAIYDTHQFEKDYLEKQNVEFGHELTFLETRLSKSTALLGAHFPCVCLFTNDEATLENLTILAKGGVKLLALRSAGFNHVDLDAAKMLNIKVVRVPDYSPFSVAEHATTLILSLNRKICKAYNRVREGNFNLDGLVGFDLHQKKVGVIGTGRIGKVFIKIMKGFGCEVLAHDVMPDLQFEKEVGVKYTTLEKVLSESDIISLHLPLTKESKHLINRKAFALMKKGVMFINTSRGGLVDTQALIDSLKSEHLGYAGLDVYEEEADYFFQDLSDQILNDDVLARLMTFPNVILTSHQGFLTAEALKNIAHTTLLNVMEFEKNLILKNEVTK